MRTARVRRLALGQPPDLIYVSRMKPSKFVSHYERMLGRPLVSDELAAIATARENSVGKRDAVKSMRAALLEVSPGARSGLRDFNLT